MACLKPHCQRTKRHCFNFDIRSWRDLAWSLWGHNLFANTATDPIAALPSELLPPDLTWLKALDHNPSPLQTFLNNCNSRLLGSYFECLWQFYFCHHPLFKRHHFNLQIHSDSPSKGQQTLGELDVLVETHSGNHYHLEMSCKFYLYHAEQELWLGPQGKDRLDIKFERTYLHQLEMLKRPETQTQICEQTDWDQNTQFEQHAIWRGCLFQPESKTAETQTTDNTIWRGQWFHASNFVNSDLFKNSHWQLLDKKLWLSPHLRDELETNNQDLKLLISDHYPTKHYALMLARMIWCSDSKQWQEQSRCMIVADDWPAGHKACRSLIPARPCNPPV